MTRYEHGIVQLRLFFDEFLVSLFDPVPRRDSVGHFVARTIMGRRLHCDNYLLVMPLEGLVKPWKYF